MSKPGKKRETVLQVVRSRIMRGVYTGKLPGERVLATELGTDRKTVNAAMIRLEMLGLVRREPSRGMFVASAGEVPGAAGMLYLHLMFPKWVSEGGHMGMYGPFLYAFERAARQHRQNMSVTYANNADEAVATTLEHARSPMCVGTCLCAIPLETRHLVSLAASSNPCVWADWDSDEAILPRVDFDNYGAGVLMAEKVLRFGHRRITEMVVSKNRAPVQENRRKGFEDALGRAGLKPVSSPDWGVMSSGEIEAVLDSPERPTAIVCRFSDDAHNVMATARSRNIRVPEDLSVTVFTSVDREGPVSRVVFDVAQLGEESFKRLLAEDVMQNPNKVVVPVSFRDEGTLGPVPGGATAP